MTRTSSGPRPLRPLISLFILLAIIAGAVIAGSFKEDGQITPKLALDLEGGTQIILTPRSDSGEEVTSEAINEAISIIRQRVDAAGVSETEITSQGGRNIVVALAGEPDQATLDLVRESAQMQFRPVLVEAGPGVIDPDEADLGDDAEDDADAPEPQNGSDPAWITPDVLKEFYALDCTLPDSLIGAGTSDPDAPLVTCDQTGQAKYILGPLEVPGSEISDANAGLRVSPTGVQTNEWAVNLEFKGEGRQMFADISRRLVNLEPPRNQFGIVLDDLVISAPRMNNVITDGKAEISGNFTRESSQTLSSQLRFGALPLSFEVQSEEQISATLGSEQLQKGLFAGVIGLFLVLLFSLYQYRGLGIVTIASLVIAGALTYGLLVVLGTLQGYRLSLPGVAGVIVAIGITADSFIVYFERVRDEVREGRSLTAAVDRGWDRAKRTILVSDAVSLMAAIVLYFLAVGGVRGFAFTLGLTTIIDVLVVYWFTHPMLTLLVRTKFFGGGHKLSGLDPKSLGQAKGAIASPAETHASRERVKVSAGGGASASSRTRGKTAAKSGGLQAPPTPAQERGSTRMTIAQRRAAEAAAAAETAQADDTNSRTTGDEGEES